MRGRSPARSGPNAGGTSLRPAPGPASASRDPPPAPAACPAPAGASLATPFPAPPSVPAGPVDLARSAPPSGEGAAFVGGSGAAASRDGGGGPRAGLRPTPPG